MPKFLARIVPIVCIFVVFISALFLILSGQAKLAQKGLVVIAVPIILASIMALLRSELFNENEPDYTPKFHIKSISFLNLILLFIIAYIISIIILISQQSRSLDYFLLVSLMGGIVMLEIDSLIPKQNGKKYLILIQIIFLFLNMSLGCTLKYPMIILGTDTFYHLGFINLIVEAGFKDYVTGMGFYLYFPLFHIFNAMGFLLTGMDLKNSYFILNGLSFILSIFLVYLIVDCAMKETKISLLTTFIYTFLRAVIDGGMYGVTRTTAYLVCLLILYLILQEKINIRFRFITIFLILPLVLLHQTTLVLFAIILILLFFIERILYESYYFRIQYILLFIVSFISYWIFFCFPFFTSIIMTLTLTNEPVFIPEELNRTSLASNVIYYLDYGIVIFMGIIGVIFLLNQREKMKSSVKHILALGTLIMLPLYIPAIADLFTSLLGYRIPLQISPFVALISGAGFSMFLFQWKKDIGHKKFLSLFCFITLLCFCFISPTLSAKMIDYDMLTNILGKENRGYFMQSELDSSSFLLNHEKKNSTIISDYLMYRFIDGYLNLNSSSFIEYPDPNSYFLFRWGEYKSIGKLDFIIKGSELGFVGELLKTLKLEENPYPIYIWTERSEIYTNEMVNIYRNGF